MGCNQNPDIRPQPSSKQSRLMKLVPNCEWNQSNDAREISLILHSVVTLLEALQLAFQVLLGTLPEVVAKEKLPKLLPGWIGHIELVLQET